MILGVDVSRYQPQVDWELLRAAGVRFAIIKATQGDYLTDERLAQHVEGANRAGMVVGVYHWCDPLRQYRSQAEYFLRAVSGLQFHMACADVEQFWADWKEWSQGNITKHLTPEVISENARNILAFWDDRLSARTILYSRASFIHSFSRPITQWAARYPLWMAHYPYSLTRVITTWDDFKAHYLPGIPGPDLPQGCTEWKIWQFTGDKFILPGATTAWDINYFNGSEAELAEFAGEPNQPETEEKPTMAYEQNAFAIQLDDRHTQATIPAGKINAVVVDLGRGTARALRHTDHLNRAQAAGVPVIGLYEIDPELCREWDFDNEERWPKGLEDPHLKVLDRQVYSGSEPRYIHGIILSFKTWQQSDGTKVTAGWQYMIMQHYMKMVYQYFKGKQQVYLMVDKGLVAQYPGTNQLTEYLAKQAYVSTYQSAYLDDPANVTLPDWDHLPRPDLTDKPGQPYGKGWQWWKFANTKFYFPGISGGYVPLWLFYRSAADLYGELGFVPAAPVPPDPEEHQPPVTPTTPSEWQGRMLALLERAVVAAEKLAGMFR